jgi:hypothetical protein
MHVLITGVDQRADRPGVNDDACGHGMRWKLSHQQAVFVGREIASPAPDRSYQAAC